MKCRHGPATVTGSRPIVFHWDASLGKEWASDDPESGELPVLKSPLVPASDGEEAVQIFSMRIFRGIMNLPVAGWKIFYLSHFKQTGAAV